MTRNRAERDALVRLKGALLDLTKAHRFTEANDVLAIIERIEPSLRDEAAGSAARLAARAGRSEVGGVVPPASSPPATFDREPLRCANCGHAMARHCSVHLLPCCPGSLMHGQDEGTWTPAQWHEAIDETLGDR